MDRRSTVRLVGVGQPGSSFEKSDHRLARGLCSQRLEDPLIECVKELLV